ncbi:hypothetical protein ACJ41O_014968 [Fusarium nematophilum]
MSSRRDHISYFKERFGASFQQIDDSSWIIFNKAILKRLLLSETEPLASDYVDEADGCLYRVQELEDHEERPRQTTMIPDDGPVRPEYRIWRPDHVEYSIGSAGRLKISTARSPNTAREHENLAYAASKNPSFRTPRALYHADDGDGRYAILVEAVGHRLHDPARPFPKPSDYLRLRDRIMDALAEMAGWEAPKFGGVGGKDVTFLPFFSHLPAAAWEDALTKEEVGKAREHRGILPDDCPSSSLAPKPVRSYCDCIEEFLGDQGFDMSRFAFLNAEMDDRSIAVDKDNNFLGFNDWGHCAFVPRGYIIPHTNVVCWYFFLGKGTVVDLNNAAIVGIGLSKRGLLEEIRFFNACVQARNRETLGFLASRPWRDMNGGLDGITVPQPLELRVTEENFGIPKE